MKNYLNQDSAQYLNNLGLGLLSSSGYSTMPQTLGSAFAKAAQSANEQYRKDQERKYNNALLGLQLKKYQREMKQPISVGAGQTLLNPETYEPVYENKRTS